MRKEGVFFRVLDKMLGHFPYTLGFVCLDGLLEVEYIKGFALTDVLSDNGECNGLTWGEVGGDFMEFVGEDLEVFTDEGDEHVGGFGVDEEAFCLNVFLDPFGEFSFIDFIGGKEDGFLG